MSTKAKRPRRRRDLSKLMPEAEPSLTCAELAGLLNVTPKSVLDYIHSGRLTGYLLLPAKSPQARPAYRIPLSVARAFIASLRIAPRGT